MNGTGIKRCIIVFLSLIMMGGTGFADDMLMMLERVVLNGTYPHEAPETRVSRLEYRMNLNVPPGSSLEYRMNRLLLASQQMVTASAQNAAIRAYNRGVEAAGAGDLTKAAEAYRQALRHNPRLIEAANNLGHILTRQRRYDEAKSVYKQALRHAPDSPALYRNLGIVCEKNGQVEEAVGYYETYLQLSPAPDEPIRTMVKNIRRAAREAADQPDYLGHIRGKEEEILWRKREVQVFIDAPTPELALFVPLVHEALETWESALDEHIRFSEVNMARLADLTISIEKGRLSDPVHEVGRARYHLVRERNSRNAPQRLKVEVTLMAGTPDEPFGPEARKVMFKRFALHELGHAIGLWGHSPNVKDLMYANPMVSGLSDRDIATARKLYGI